MKIRLLFLLLAFHLPGLIQAQNVGINNPTPDPSSLLDLTSTTRGILIPRVSIPLVSAAAPVTAPATGLLVFNTNPFTAFGNGVGFYYWNGTRWIKVLDGGPNNAWETNGNAATNPIVNFIGTTDNQPLQFRVDNKKAGSIDQLNENVTLGFLAGNLVTTNKNNVLIGDSAFGISTSSINAVVIGAGAASNGTNALQSVIIGADAGKKNAAANNVFNGFESGLNNSSGFANTFIGSRSGRGNISGSHNTITGFEAGMSFITSFGNTFMGSLSGRFSTGNFNSFFGEEAGLNTTTGAENVFVGSDAGRSNTIGQFNTYIGDDAGLNDTTSNLNTYVGNNAGLFSRNGSENTFIGSNTGPSFFSGTFNTALGSRVSISNNLTNTTAIGYRAFANASNTMVLGSVAGINGATSNVDVGIGTSTPQDRLHVVGNIRMVDGLQASGKVLMSDAFGRASWQNLIASDANAWGLTGNTATNPSVNFIGTTDNQPLQFRVNNSKAGSIDQLNENVTLGSRSGFNITTGRNNVIIGDSAFNSINSIGVNGTTGSVVIGSGAASAALKINNSVVIGSDAGKSNSAQDVVVLGFESGIKNVADGNIFIGSKSGRANVGGCDNTMVGFESGMNNVASCGNTFLGFETGRVSLGNSNTFIGAQAGLNNLAGSKNIFLGRSSGINNASGESNVYIGTDAGRSSTTSNSNVAIGSSALRNSTASDLVAVGDSALISLTSGTGNTALGSKAGAANVSATDNTFIGFKAGRSSIGSSNIGSNTAVGMNSMLNSTTGFQNTAVGRSSLLQNSTGSANVAIGLSALLSNTSGGSNVALGAGAGFDNVTGSQNTLIGNNADVGSSNLTNATAIGSQAFVSTNNSLVLGSVAGINGAASNVNVGIGTTSPLYMLDVRGNATFNEDGGNNDFRVEAVGNSNMFLVDAGDTAVKIGTNFTTDEMLRVGFSTGHGIHFGSAETIEDGGANTLQTNANFIPETNNLRNLGSTTNRWVTLFATNGTINTSDARDKENIRPIHYGLNEVLKLNPVQFNWKDRPFEGVKIGLIAQELNEVISEVVVSKEYVQKDENSTEWITKDADRLGVYYSDLIPVLIKSIQEQQEMIEQSKMEIQELKKQLEDLKLKH